MFNPAQKPATTFTLTATSTAAPATGFSFGGGSGDKTQNAAKPPMFGATPTPSFGFTPTASSASSTGLNFGITSSTATSQPNLAFSAPTALNLAKSTPQFSFGSTTSAVSTPQTSSTSFVPVISSSGSGLGNILSSTVSSSTSTGLTVKPAALPTITSIISTPHTSVPSSASGAKLTFNLPQVTSVSAAVTTATPAPVTATSAPSTLQTTAVSSNVSYNQLEDQINKWTIDLEEQGKHFINQAKQLNAWDSLLIQNGDKIRILNSSIERVKQEQQQLDQGLDFVVAQQKELEELIVPLEKELANIPQSTDQERNRIYQLAESMDSQMKQMSEDLKGIIEHLNESNKEEDVNDPVTQISRILNAHMNSLQWIDRNTAQISSYLEQISKMQDMNRRNNAIDL